MSPFLAPDFSQFTLHQAIGRCFPRARARYEVRLPDSLAAQPLDPSELRTRLLEALRGHQADAADLQWLWRTGQFQEDYLRRLGQWRVDGATPANVTDGAGAPSLAVEGRWFEILPMLAPLTRIVWQEANSAGAAAPDPDRRWPNPAELLQLDCDWVQHGGADGATRPDESAPLRERLEAWREAALAAPKRSPGKFLGTGSPALARELGLPTIDGMEHQWLAAHRIFSGARWAVRDAHLRWMQGAPHAPGPALVDETAIETFFDTFDRVLAEAFSGMQAQPAEPSGYVEQALRFYDHRGIDARDKALHLHLAAELRALAALVEQIRGRARLVVHLHTTSTPQGGDESPRAGLRPALRLTHINERALNEAPGSTRPPPRGAFVHRPARPRQRWRDRVN